MKLLALTRQRAAACVLSCTTALSACSTLPDKLDQAVASLDHDFETKLSYAYPLPLLDPAGTSLDQQHTLAYLQARYVRSFCAGPGHGFG